MKLKNLVISVALTISVSSAVADPGSFIVGAIVGAIITQPHQHPVYVQQPQPVYIQHQQPVYIQQPQPVYIQQQPVYINEQDMRGYCPYQGELYYQCLGNMQRKKNEEAYARGYRGY